MLLSSSRFLLQPWEICNLCVQLAASFSRCWFSTGVWLTQFLLRRLSQVPAAPFPKGLPSRVSPESLLFWLDSWLPCSRNLSFCFDIFVYHVHEWYIFTVWVRQAYSLECSMFKPLHYMLFVFTDENKINSLKYKYLSAVLVYIHLGFSLSIYECMYVTVCKHI